MKTVNTKEIAQHIDRLKRKISSLDRRNTQISS